VADKSSERDPEVLEKLSYCQNVVLAGGSYNNVLKPASAKNAGWPLPSPSPKRRRRQQGRSVTGAGPGSPRGSETPEVKHPHTRFFASVFFLI
jgi:hypothetical protein